MQVSHFNKMKNTTDYFNMQVYSYTYYAREGIVYVKSFKFQLFIYLFMYL